jgi:type IV pilus assembly protein PilC
MPNFLYIAKGFDGRTEKGILPAEDVRQLALDLKNQNLILITAEEEGKKKGLNFMNLSLPSFGVSLKEKIMLVRNLWIMTSTGLSIVRSFTLLANQTKNTKLKKALLNIKEEVSKGNSFSGSLAKYPDIFSELFLSMVKVGEESGTLEDVFKVLSLQMEKEYTLKSKVKGAMIYPLIILMVMLGIGIIMLIFVFPQLTAFFDSLNADLPIYTKIMIWGGNFMMNQWYVVLLAVLIIVGIFWQALKTNEGKWLLSTILIKIPLISSLVKKNNSAVLIRSLSSLNASGVPLIRSLEIISGVVGNYYYKKAVVESIERIKKGEKLSSALREHKDIFPFGAIEIIEVGEETGKSTVILKKLAEFYENEVIDMAENMSAIIEPVMILILGMGVAVFAFSIISPMYSVLGNI